MDEYLIQLSRYIHLNPVSAGIVQNPEDYPWPSYKNYLQPNKKQHWLYCGYTLNFFGLENQSLNYHQFVLQGIEENKKFHLNKKKFPILGSKNFIQKTKEEYFDPAVNKEIPEKAAVLKHLLPTIDDIIQAVADYYQVPHFNIISIGNKKLGNLPRQIAIFFAFKMLGKTRKKIVEKFNGLSYQSISPICSRITATLKTNEKLCEDIKKIKSNLTIV